MKKKIILILSILIITSIYLAVKFNDAQKTVEEAININGTNKIEIIHQEKNDKGIIVFIYTPENDGLYTAVVRKVIGGYKTAYSGYEGDIKFVAERFGLTYSYFPNIKKTALPIYFGVIGDPDITEVKIIEKKRNIQEKAKIINADDTRIWLMYMDKFEGSDFDIIGLSSDARELIRIDGNIYPHYADQKPFKGYK